METKRYIFIRHGESEWNEVFNRGFHPIKFPIRLIKAIIREFILLVSKDSIFVDTPLCDTGKKQAEKLYKFVKEYDVEKDPTKCKAGQYLVSRDASKSSVVVCSNLRRAMSTALIGLQDRLKTSNEKVYMLSCLQEISRNIDANCISEKYTVPDMHGVEKSLNSWNFNAENVFDTSAHKGQKPIFGKGIQRLWDFNDWAFKRQVLFLISIIECRN